MEVTLSNVGKRYPVGYALSGGFIKGFAHLGIIQALLEHDIKPDIISGVSAGAVAGVFFADGKEPYNIVELFKGHKFQDLTKFVVPKRGLFELNEFMDFIRSNLKTKRLEDLPIPLIVTATDLDHCRSIHFHKGNIAERVAASCCMPVIFSPVTIDGTNYVDGGVMQNLPVSVIRRICEKVVAINVSPLIARDYKMNMMGIGIRSYNIMFRANTFVEKEKSDLVIEATNLESYNNTALDKAEEIFNKGYYEAYKKIEQLLSEKHTIWKEK